MESLERFRILTVCTGNICRSPVSEILLQSGLDELHPEKFSVSSAGTHALVGQAMQPLSAAIVQRNGGVAGGFSARQLTPTMVREADLVLTMAAEHRARVLQLEPAALRRTFTIREFGRMLEHLAFDEVPDRSSDDIVLRWRELPGAAASVRHRSLAEHPLDNDVVDPYRRSDAEYRSMEEQLIPALDTILTLAASPRPAKQGRHRSQH